MLKIKKLTLKQGYYPDKLRNIPSPPQQLFYLGASLEKLLEQLAIGIVGSRRVTPYGKVVTQKLAGELAGKGIVIVSGLALGVDGIAHQAALDAGGKTIAILPCGLDRVYPSTHHNLAKQILEQGGALITEYPEGTEPYPVNFVARNRIVSGLSDALLITEAAEKSGTLHTANFALEQGKEVMAVPGNITSPLSTGTNNLIKTGAMPVTEVNDILHALNLEPAKLKQQDLIAANEEEHGILILIRQGVVEGDKLLAQSKLEPALFNQTLTMLEITGKIKPLGGDQWTLL